MNEDGSLPGGDWRGHHKTYIEDRAISPVVADQRHYCTIEGPSDPYWAELPFTKAQRHAGLIIPTFGPAGQVNGVQLRLDTVRPDAEGKLQRYLNPPRIPAKRLDVHPGRRELLTDPSKALWVTEGIAKADALTSHGAVAVGITGVGTWECDDWKQIVLHGRDVYVVFDSDYATNPNVSKQRAKLAAFLHHRGARVHLTELPPKDQETLDKLGVDDWLALRPAEERFTTAPLFVLRGLSETYTPPPTSMTFESLAEVDDAPACFLIDQLLLQRETCVAAGAEKSLKSWCALCAAVSVVSGVPLFGHDGFRVFKTGKVLIISGEGSSRLVRRRIAKLCEALGVDFNEVAQNVIVTDDTAPVTSEGFRESVRSAVDQHDPVLVILDPLYTYMPSGEADQAGNLFKMGPLYATVREVVGDRSLIIVTHFNKAGRDTLELSSITQAGGREFAPSWWLIRHTKDPDVNEQSFGLEVRAGGREGFGHEFGLDVQLPRLVTHGSGEIEHVGLPSFRVTSADAVRDEINWRQVLYTRIFETPWTETQSEILGSGDGYQARAKAFKWLADTKQLITTREVRPEGKPRKVRCWGPVFPTSEVEIAAISAEQVTDAL